MRRRRLVEHRSSACARSRQTALVMHADVIHLYLLRPPACIGITRVRFSNEPITFRKSFVLPKVGDRLNCYLTTERSLPSDDQPTAIPRSVAIYIGLFISVFRGANKLVTCRQHSMPHVCRLCRHLLTRRAPGNRVGAISVISNCSAFSLRACHNCDSSSIHHTYMRLQRLLFTAERLNISASFR